MHWETVYGFKFVYRTKHHLTHGVNPNGEYVTVYRERQPGRYEWSISLSDDEPTYTWATGNDMACKWEGGGEYMGISLSDLNDHDWSEIEYTMITGSDAMGGQDNCHILHTL